MAQIQNKTHDTKPQSPSCFLGCFGFSEKKVSKKKSLGKSGSGSRKMIRWFSSSRFRMKKRGTKTVPVDVSMSEKTNQSIKNPTSKSKSGKVPSRRQIPDTGHNSAGQIPAVVSDESIIERPQKTRYGPEQSSILENRKHLDHLDSTKDDTCPKRLSFGRKIESIRTGLSHPGSPETKPKSSSTSVRNREKRTGKTSRNHRENDVDDVGKFDSMIGMSIIMVTLIMMLLWGRLCAILCTSAWFYFVPRLRASINSSDNIKYRSNLDDAELNSEEYKKKVVLEGFLERKHRNSVGIL